MVIPCNSYRQWLAGEGLKSLLPLLAMRGAPQGGAGSAPARWWLGVWGTFLTIAAIAHTSGAIPRAWRFRRRLHRPMVRAHRRLLRLRRGLTLAPTLRRGGVLRQHRLQAL